MNKKQKKMLVRIIIASVLMIALNFVPVTGAVRFILYMVPYLTIGYDILIKAGKGIKNRQVFDESFLMAVATIGAMALAVTGDGDYTEAIAVMLFLSDRGMVPELCGRQKPEKYQRTDGYPPGLCKCGD